MRRAASAGACTSSPALAKGEDSPLSTVPGWIATIAAPGLARRSSMDAVRTSWFNAALDAR